MYKAISKHPHIQDQYAKKLIQESVMSEQEYQVSVMLPIGPSSRQWYDWCHCLVLPSDRETEVRADMRGRVPARQENDGHKE